MINLYNLDCLPAMKAMPDKAYELAIVDPPYGIGFDGEVPSMVLHPRSTKWKDPHLTGYLRKEWDKTPPPQEYFSELIRVSTDQIIFGGNHFTLPQSSGWIFWDKVNGDFSLGDGELAWTSFNRAVRQFTFIWHGFRRGEKVIRIHPTQKPVRLYEWLLQNYAKPGDRILDTHGGSGSICIACDILGFDLDWYEIDADYFQAAKERLERHQRQQVLDLK